jgi:hypothetical protein
VIDGALDRKELERLLAERSLAGQSLGIKEVYKIREDMDRIEARRLQPHFIESFFIGAYSGMNGQIRKRPDKRYNLPNVPKALRESRSQIGVPYPIARNYAAITFEKEAIHIDGRVDDATLICPGHPLLSALIDEILGESQKVLKQGTVFIDDTDSCKGDRLLFYIEDILEDGRIDSAKQSVKASHRMHFIEIDKDGNAQSAGLAPYLDYTVPATDELPVIQKLLQEKAWWGANVEGIARDYAVRNLMPQHLNEVRTRRTEYVNKVEVEVRKRLNTEIVYWDTQAGIYSDKAANGAVNARLNADRCKERVDNLEQRLKQRLEDLVLERTITSKPPTVLGGAWIVPRSMLQNAIAPDTHTKNTNDADAESRREIEIIGMGAVMSIEKELGNIPIDVSKLNLGYDIESKTPDNTLRFIEVKGRAQGKPDVTVSHNEMKTAANAPDKCLLAVIVVDGNKRTATYFANWIDQGPGFAETNRSLNLQKLRTAARVALEREVEEDTHG